MDGNDDLTRRVFLKSICGTSAALLLPFISNSCAFLYKTQPRNLLYHLNDEVQEVNPVFARFAQTIPEPFIIEAVHPSAKHTIRSLSGKDTLRDCEKFLYNDIELEVKEFPPITILFDYSAFEKAIDGEPSYINYFFISYPNILDFRVNLLMRFPAESHPVNIFHLSQYNHETGKFGDLENIYTFDEEKFREITRSVIQNNTIMCNGDPIETIDNSNVLPEFLPQGLKFEMLIN